MFSSSRPLYCKAGNNTLHSRAKKLTASTLIAARAFSQRLEQRFEWVILNVDRGSVGYTNPRWLYGVAEASKNVEERQRRILQV
jgi:hypothetical protein